MAKGAGIYLAAGGGDGFFFAAFSATGFFVVFIAAGLLTTFFAIAPDARQNRRQPENQRQDSELKIATDMTISIVMHLFVTG